jgi:hypothetical protein
MYWSKKFKLEIVANAIPRDRFYLLRVNFHVVNNLAASDETRKKLQPMIHLIRDKCRGIQRYVGSFPIDEQITISWEVSGTSIRVKQTLTSGSEKFSHHYVRQHCI